MLQTITHGLRLLQLDLSAAFDTLDKPTLLRRLDQIP